MAVEIGTGTGNVDLTSLEEQLASIADGKLVFKEHLDMLVQKAFKVGVKIGKGKADTKDSAMYEAEVSAM